MDTGAENPPSSSTSTPAVGSAASTKRLVAAEPTPTFKTLRWSGLTATYDAFEQSEVLALVEAVPAGGASRNELEVIHTLKALFDARQLCEAEMNET